LRIIAHGKKKSTERRLDKLCLRASKERRELLRAAAEGVGPPPPGPLPSSVTAGLEIANPHGKILLSLVEAKVWTSLMDAPAFNELVFDDQQCPYLTPMLPKGAPDTVFHVYWQIMVRSRYHFIYQHVKDATKTQTLYIMYCLESAPGRAIKELTLSRATEYHTVCNAVYVEGITVTKDVKDMTVKLSAPLKITTAARTTRVDMPDRKKTWAPHRFTYGNRRFVWKDESKRFKEMESLYEVRSETLVHGSKTGKVQDETFERPIAWICYKIASEKAAVVGMVGGLDQLFQEFILAGALSKQVIGLDTEISDAWIYQETLN